MNTTEQFDTCITMNLNTNRTETSNTDSFFNTNLTKNYEDNKKNNFKEEIMKSGLVNLNDLFEKPKNKKTDYMKNYEDKMYKISNNDDDFFD